MHRWLLRFSLLAALVVLGVTPALADMTKLDPAARVALAKMRNGDAVQDLSAGGRLAVSSTGDLDVFIIGEVTRAQLEAAGAIVRTEVAGIFTAWVPEDRMEAVAAITQVRRIEGAVIVEENNDLGAASTGATIFRGAGPTFTGINGAGVIVGNVDSGVDYDHENFKDALGQTRILKFWDQNVAGSPPAGFAYGTEWNSAQINSLASTGKDTNGHGSHTMGTAAGDGSQVGTAGSAPAFTYAGMAPMADIIVVDGSNTGSYSTARILDGINYIMGQATAFGMNCAINVSLGGQFGEKDGTSAFETAVDALCGPGKIVVFSQGNDRGAALHAEWQAGNPAITMSVTGGGTGRFVAINGYYEATEQMDVTITTPGGFVVGPVALGGLSGSYPGTPTPANGSVYIENGVALTATSDKQVYIELNGTGVQLAGTWTITLTPVIIGPANCELDLWKFSFNTTTANFVSGNQPTEEMGNALATGFNTVAAGAWVTRQSWTDCRAANWNDPTNVSFSGSLPIGNLANFSAPGPTRDGRMKPDVSGPGTAIISVRSTDVAAGPCTGATVQVPGLAHTVNQGTSMSAPHVTGAIALLYQKYGALTPADVKTKLHDRAVVDGFVTAFGAAPNKDFGWGKLNLGDMVDPTCTVTSPNGGEILVIGSGANLTWSAGDLFGSITGVDLELSRDGGTLWETIATGVPNTGTYAWTVTGPVTSNAILRATAKDGGNNTGADVSNAVWAITSPVAVVVSQFRAEPVTEGVRLVWEFADASMFTRVSLERAGAATGPWSEVDAQFMLEGSATTALDRSVQAGQTYFYRLATIDRDGRGATFGPLTATAGRPILEYALDGISPNPTEGPAVIDYSVPRASDVSVIMYDLQGREVATLASGAHPVGRYHVTWSGEVDGGLAKAGVYFVRLTAPKVTQTRRVVVSH